MSKKEEVLRKVFFKEASKMDEARGPIFQAGNMIMNRGLKAPGQRDVHTTLLIIEHALAESMYIKDINSVVAAGAKQFINLQ